MSDLTVICRKQFIQAQKNKSPFFSNTVSIQNSVNQEKIIGAASKSCHVFGLMVRQYHVSQSYDIVNTELIIMLYIYIIS